MSAGTAAWEMSRDRGQRTPQSGRKRRTPAHDRDEGEKEPTVTCRKRSATSHTEKVPLARGLRPVHPHPRVWFPYSDQLRDERATHTATRYKVWGRGGAGGKDVRSDRVSVGGQKRDNSGIKVMTRLDRKTRSMVTPDSREEGGGEAGA